MKGLRLLTVLPVTFAVLLGGCGLFRDSQKTTAESFDEAPADIVIEKEPETFTFVAYLGDTYTVTVNPLVEKHTYNLDGFVHNGDRLSYTGDPRYTSRLGVDVSRYQGSIDWTAVRDAGYTFAIVRLGYRGYGQAGTLNMDSRFGENLAGAKEAGLDVGVYFYAQAINEEEAVEEAEYVLRALNGTELELPVVYDPESVTDDVARTDNVSGEQFTRNTLAFCQTITDAHYDAMIYCNMLWEAFELDLSQLDAYPLWYADYEPLPQTPYRFSFWQYTNAGRVPGIAGDVDLNIQLIPVE